MESVTSQALKTFFQRLGEQIPAPARLYLLGGSALCLLGSPRETLDVDYFIENATPEIEQTLERLAAELKLDLEPVILGEFVPLPPEAEARPHLAQELDTVMVNKQINSNYEHLFGYNKKDLFLLVFVF